MKGTFTLKKEHDRVLRYNNRLSWGKEVACDATWGVTIPLHGLGKARTPVTVTRQPSPVLGSPLNLECVSGIADHLT